MACSTSGRTRNATPLVGVRFIKIQLGLLLARELLSSGHEREVTPIWRHPCGTGRRDRRRVVESRVWVEDYVCGHDPSLIAVPHQDPLALDKVDAVRLVAAS